MDMSTAIAEEIYLGKIIYGNHLARLEPIAEVVDGRWIAMRDKEGKFPPEGKVFATSWSYGDHGCFVFSRRPNQLPKKEKRDEFLVDQVAPAIPIVDMSGLTLEEARHRLFESGFSLPVASVGHPVVVLLRDHLFCTVECRQGDAGVWKAVPVREHTDLFAAPEGWQHSMQIDGFRYVPHRAVPASEPVKRVNWCSDAEFVALILNKFRKYALEEGKYAGFSKDSIQYIARALERGELLSTDSEDIELNLERLKSQWPRLEARFAASQDMRAAILDSDVAKEAIETAVSAARAEETTRLRVEIEGQVRAELQELLAESYREKDALLEELEQLSTSKGEIQKSVSELEEKCNHARLSLESLTAEIHREIRQLSSALETVSPAELPAARSLAERLEAAMARRDISASLLSSSTPPWSMTSGKETSDCVSLSEFKARLEEEGKTYGVAPADLFAVDTFVRAGELVLLTGAHADRTLTAYARSASAGSAFSMALDPTIVGLEDIWRIVGSQAPTAFAHAWGFAKTNPDRAVVLCFRSFDSAPVHLWLSAFSSVLHSSLRPANLLVFAIPIGVRTDLELEYPFREDVERWLVPIQPGPHPDGSLVVLNSMDERSSATSLKWELPAEGGGIPAPLVRALSNDGADAETVLRASRLAAATADEDWNEGLLPSWLRFRCSGKADDLLGCLREGHLALDKLNYQR